MINSLKVVYEKLLVPQQLQIAKFLFQITSSHKRIVINTVKESVVKVTQQQFRLDAVSSG